MKNFNLLLPLVLLMVFFFGATAVRSGERGVPQAPNLREADDKTSLRQVSSCAPPLRAGFFEYHSAERFDEVPLLAEKEKALTPQNIDPSVGIQLKPHLTLIGDASGLLKFLVTDKVTQPMMLASIGLKFSF